MESVRVIYKQFQNCGGLASIINALQPESLLISPTETFAHWLDEQWLRLANNNDPSDPLVKMCTLREFKWIAVLDYLYLRKLNSAIKLFRNRLFVDFLPYTYNNLSQQIIRNFYYVEKMSFELLYQFNRRKVDWPLWNYSGQYLRDIPDDLNFTRLMAQIQQFSKGDDDSRDEWNERNCVIFGESELITSDMVCKHLSLPTFAYELQEIMVILGFERDYSINYTYPEHIEHPSIVLIHRPRTQQWLTDNTFFGNRDNIINSATGLADTMEPTDRIYYFKLVDNLDLLKYYLSILPNAFPQISISIAPEDPLKLKHLKYSIKFPVKDSMVPNQNRISNRNQIPGMIRKFHCRCCHREVFDTEGDKPLLLCGICIRKYEYDKLWQDYLDGKISGDDLKTIDLGQYKRIYYEQRFPFINKNTFLTAFIENNRPLLRFEVMDPETKEIICKDELECIHTVVSRISFDEYNEIKNNPDAEEKFLRRTVEIRAEQDANDCWDGDDNTEEDNNQDYQDYKDNDYDNQSSELIMDDENEEGIELEPEDKFFAFKSWVQGIAEAGIDALRLQSDLDQLTEGSLPIAQFLFRNMIRVDPTFIHEYINKIERECRFEGAYHKPSLHANLNFILDNVCSYFAQKSKGYFEEESEWVIDVLIEIADLDAEYLFGYDESETDDATRLRRFLAKTPEFTSYVEFGLLLVDKHAKIRQRAYKNLVSNQDELEDRLGFQFVMEIYKVAISRIQNRQEEYFDYLYNLSVLAFTHGLYDECLQYYADTLDKHPLSKGLNSMIHNNIGYLWFLRGNYTQAEREYNIAFSWIENLRSGQEYMYYLRNMGSLEMMRGNYQLASNHFQESQTLAEQQHDTSMIIENFIGLIELHLKQGYFDEALQYCNKALDIAKTLKSSSIAKVFGRFGNIYFALKNYTQAIDQYTKALAINERLILTYEQSQNLIGLGKTYQMQGNNAQAKLYKQKALEILKQLKIKYIA